MAPGEKWVPESWSIDEGVGGRQNSWRVVAFPRMLRYKLPPMVIRLQTYSGTLQVTAFFLIPTAEGSLNPGDPLNPGKEAA